MQQKQTLDLQILDMVAAMRNLNEKIFSKSVKYFLRYDFVKTLNFQIMGLSLAR